MISVNCARHGNYWYRYDFMDVRLVIGAVISLLAKRDGFSQVGLANYCGVSESVVSRWKAGKIFPLGYLNLIAEYFKVPLKTLFDEDLAAGNTPIPLDISDEIKPREAARTVEKIKEIIPNASLRDIAYILAAASDLVVVCSESLIRKQKVSKKTH